jgi:hypothetical protein
MMNAKGSIVFRIRGLPEGRTSDEVRATLKSTIENELSQDERSRIKVEPILIPSCYGDGGGQAALLEFRGEVPSFLSDLIKDPLSEWQLEMGDTDINIDRHFFGFTQLYYTGPEHPISAE